MGKQTGAETHTSCIIAVAVRIAIKVSSGKAHVVEGEHGHSPSDSMSAGSPLRLRRVWLRGLDKVRKSIGDSASRHQGMHKEDPAGGLRGAGTAAAHASARTHRTANASHGNRRTWRSAHQAADGDGTSKRQQGKQGIPQHPVRLNRQCNVRACVCVCA